MFVSVLFAVFRTRVGKLIGTAASLLVLMASHGSASSSHSETDATPATPTTKIGLQDLGFTGLSAGARQSGGSNLSVDFLDAQHLLLTFNPKKLFKRLPDCPPTHSDRQVHVVVIEVPSGKVVKESDWYLHDLNRYVWNLGEGQVLLRRLNKLYVVNANLEEKQVFESPKDLLWVSVTSDGKQIIAETPASPSTSPARANSEKNTTRDSKDSERVQITFLDAKTLAVQRTFEVRGRIKLEGSSVGVANLRKQGSNWLVEFAHNYIARVKSRRAPSLLYPSANTMLVSRCTVSRNGYGISAFTVAGSFLWRQRWDECRYSAVVRNSEDGARFAMGSLTLRPPDENEEGLEQHIQVADTATGKFLLSVKGMAAVLDGQNFALSADSKFLGVVEGTTLDIYELPDMTPEDRARYIAVKADTPSLNAPPSGRQGEAQEEEFTSSSNIDSEESEPKKEAIAANSASPPPAAPASASTPTEPSDLTPTLTLRTGTQVVALDVVVTDSSGKLVKGLPQSDFVVSEDAKPQSVRYFKEFVNEQPAARPPARQKDDLPPNVFSNYSASAEEGAVTVVMLDLLNTPMTAQIYAQDQLVKFLKNKPKDAKFALCILGDRLQMIQGFTEDQTVLLAAAKGKKGSQRRRPLQDVDSPIPVQLEAGRETARFLPSLDFFVESIAMQQSEARLIDADQRMIVTVDAFAHLARYLAGIPGRKNLVWMSGSFVLGIYPESNGRNPFLESHSYGENLKKVANLLGEAHVAVYPVDVKGLETDPLFTASTNSALSPITMVGPAPNIPANSSTGGRGMTPAPNATTAVPIAVMNDQLDQFRVTQMDEHSTMQKLAEQTGGQAFYNTNGIAQAIRVATEQGSNYYALSYTPSNKKYDGGFRRVKVTLPTKKYHLAYRSGYYAIDPYAPAKPSKDLASSLARAAMQQGSPQSRQIVFGARVVPIGKPRVLQAQVAVSAKPTKKHKDSAPLEMQRYGIDHAVTFSDLRFNTGTDGSYHDVLNFMVTTFDDEGKLTASQVTQTVADLKPETLKDVMAGGLRLHQEIEVPAKSVAMRLGVEDESNSHIGTIEIKLPVPPPPEGQEVTRRSLPPVEPD